MTDSLRIAMVSMHTSPVAVPGSADAGGMNVVELAQALELGRRGHQVEMFTRRSDATLPASVSLGEGVSLHLLAAGPATPLPKSAIDQHIPEFAEAFAGAMPECDVIHSHHWMSGVAAVEIARSRGIPHVQSFHSIAASPQGNLSEGERPESAARSRGERRVARESDAVVAISAHEAATALTRLGALPERVHIVPPGVDGELFHPGGDVWESPPLDARGYVVFAGRLEPLKGADLAVAALGHVPPKICPHLVVAGESAPDFADHRLELEQMAADLGIADRISFVGAQSREGLAALLRGALLTLVPSHSETYGLVASESAACGTPVVASAAGGLVEAVVDGETGLLLDTREPADWGHRITELLIDSDRRQRMAQVSVIHARRLTWDSSTDDLERVYRRVVESR